MKKYLFFLSLFFSFFVITPKAFALASLTVDYSSNTAKTCYFTDEGIAAGEQMRNYLNNSTFYQNYDYIISIYSSDNCTNQYAKALIISPHNYLPVVRFNNQNNNQAFMNIRYYNTTYNSSGIYSSSDRVGPQYYNMPSGYGFSLSELQQYENGTLPTEGSNFWRISNFMGTSNSSGTINFPTCTYGTWCYMTYYSTKDIYTGTQDGISQTTAFSTLTTVNTDSGFEVSEPFGGRYYTYMDTITNNTPPIVSSFGRGQYGLNSNYILIGSRNVDNIECPDNTDFVNGFCQTGYFNYSSDDDLLNDNLIPQFDFKSTTEIPFISGHYYTFTFRVNSLVPISLINMYVRSGTSSFPTDIIKINVIENGAYRDIQVLFTPTSSNISVVVDSIYFQTGQLSNYDIDPSTFVYGVYKVYKYTDFGTTIPDDSSLNNDYQTNSINSISNNDSNNFFNNFSFNAHGVSGIVTSPLRLFNAIINSNTCTPLSFTFPHSNNTITLPCLQSYLSTYLGSLWTLLQFIFSGFICYRIAVNILRTIKEVSSPTSDEIEVVDL